MQAQRNWQRLKTDPAFRARMELRSRIIAAVRGFFASAGFLEVETPTVVATPGMEPHLDPLATVVTRNDGMQFKANLITSPEYAMKKLLAGGLPRIFEFARSYRNGEPWDGGHNPEFTMLEWYRADADYTDIMRDMEEMVAAVAREIHGSEQFTFQGNLIDVSTPWPRITVAEAMRKYCKIDLNRAVEGPGWFRVQASIAGLVPRAEDSWEDVFFKWFLRDVEPNLGQPEAPGEPMRPVILYDYPVSMAALSRLKASDPRYAERFEAYVGGVELANAFSELNDGVEQRRRLMAEQAERKEAEREVFKLDEQFLAAVAQMPPSAGIALGVDRLVALLADASSIKEVQFFPAEDLFG